MSAPGTLPELVRPLALGAALLGLGFGVAGWAAGIAGHEAAFVAGTVPVLLALLAEIVLSLRRGEVGLDIVAALSMSAALAFGEPLAAAVVALMYAGGQYLESFAAGRARREMTALLARVPRSALRHGAGGPEAVPLDAIVPGDRLLMRRGDVVPVDGTAEAAAVLDLSALTGEALPVRVAPGGEVPSGAGNAGEAFTLRAARGAAESTFAGIVRLVAAAEAQRAPMVRLADRFALGFLALTLALAGAAWALSGDPVRAVAVLVVATPCPLILAVPVAMVAGLGRGARQGILFKGGAALERLAGARVAVIDKTGTLTEGRARVTEIRPLGGLGPDAVLALAASLDLASAHPVAAALVAEARARGLPLLPPEAVAEVPGEGIAGRVGGRWVVLGGLGHVERAIGWDASAFRAGRGAGALLVAVAVEGRAEGVITLADGLREDAAALVAGLRAAGIGRIVLATGDRRAVAEAVAGGLPIDRIAADLSPQDKVIAVIAERRHGPVMMVGDGVNDAPALAAADVGIAMGARGTAASAEAAEVVILVDRIDRVLAACRIARETRAVALQSVAVGLGLSLAGMVAAAAGLLPPVAGALFQEAIDVAVILNALRAMRGRGDAAPALQEGASLRVASQPSPAMAAAVPRQAGSPPRV